VSGARHAVRPPDVRLTRRGRLLLQTLPAFLVCAAGVQALAHRADSAGDAARTPRAAAATGTPADIPSGTPAPSARATPSGPSAAASPRPAASRSAAPPAARPAISGTGRLAVVPGQSSVHGSGPLRRFMVEVEAGLGEDPKAFAAAVERVLFDQRGWGGGGRLSFQRVSSGPVAFRVTLASPRTTDRLCAPLDTGGIYSCYHAGRSVLNAMRWRDGAAAYPHDLTSYRTYMVNHEVGHALGHGHRYSCGSGGLAPVMMQQTKSLYGCRQNVWPLAAER
jgi:hypothetical protein